MSHSSVTRSENGRMGEKRGMKALEAWCKRVTDGYKGVSVENMTTSWRDGLAFCAIIHHFRPDLIDFDSLDKNDVFRNNELAFRTAEHQLGIPALLDAEDMVLYEVPDRLSILTYLSQFYQTFTGHGSSPTRSLAKRPASAADSLSSVSESPPTKVAAMKVGCREPCTKCGMPVFIAERLLVGGHLYHRTCFRCARCQTQLSVANCYETEGGEYCCETCPDEVLADKENRSTQNELDMIGHAGPEDQYSAEFESAMEDSIVNKTKEQLTPPKFSKAQSDFMSTQLTLESSQNSLHSDSEERGPADQKVLSSLPLQSTESPVKDHHTGSFKNVNKLDEDSSVVSSASSRERAVSVLTKYFSKNSDISQTAQSSDCSGNDIKKDVPISVSSKSVNTSEEKLSVANIVNSEDASTKDSDSDEFPTTNIVKARMKMFEKNTSAEDKETKTLSNKRFSINQRNSSNEDESKHINGAALKDLIQKDVSIDKDDKGKPVDKITIVTGKSDVDEDQLFEGIYEDSVKTESQISFDDLSAEDNEITKDTLQLDKSDTPKAVSPIARPPESEMQTSSSSEIVEKSEVTYPTELNPFGDDDEVINASPKRKEVKTSPSLNPFGSSDDEDDDEIMPAPVDRTNKQRVIGAPKLNLNPFWSDGEEPSSEGETSDRRTSMVDKPPIPKPRTVIGVSPQPSPRPRKSTMNNIDDKFGSISSLSSLNSSTGGTTQRKKKPAPTPPRAQDVFLGVSGTPSAHSANSSRASSPSPSSLGLSPKTLQRRKKSRPAPQPPSSLTFAEAKLMVSDPEWEREKNKKDVANRNRQSQALSSLSPESPSELQLSVGPNKSTYGQWKRKKGPAPPRPVPQRRQIKAIPMKDVKRELDDIEVKQQELERQGVTLEKTIREKFEQQPNSDNSSMTPDVEDLVLQLFELVNEKNELFRRQAELMYLRRQQRLEEEHADLEYQIRCLMLRPEHTKTDSDKAREEELIQRLVEVVERRNEIVECLEMDRIREAEEDRSIHSRLGMFSKGKTLTPEDSSKSYSGKKQKKKNKKDKEKNSSKKIVKPGLDADKDIDEVEEAVPKNAKEKKAKKKWF